MLVVGWGGDSVRVLPNGLWAFTGDATTENSFLAAQKNDTGF